MNNDVHLQALIEKSMQLKIMHINTRSMISTYDGLLLKTILRCPRRLKYKQKRNSKYKKIKRNKKKENANEKKKMQIEKENANKTKT